MAFLKKFPVYKLIGLLLLILYLKYADLSGFSDLLRGMDLRFFAGALFLIPVQLILKAIRWKLLLKALSCRNVPGYASLFRYYWAGLFFGIFTPGRLGDIGKFKFLCPDDQSKCFTATFGDRLWDLVWLLMMGAFSLAFTFSDAKEALYSIPLIICLGLCLAVWKRKFLIEQVIRRVAPKGVENFVGWTIELFRPSQILLNSLLTIVSLFIFYARMYLVSKGLGIPITYFQVFLVCSSVSLVMLIPVSVMGLGTREVTIHYYFQQMGFTSSQSLAFSSLMLLIALIDGISGYFSFLTIKAPDKKEIAEQSQQRI